MPQEPTRLVRTSSNTFQQVTQKHAHTEKHTCCADLSFEVQSHAAVAQQANRLQAGRRPKLIHHLHQQPASQLPPC
jgi:hypothetical protein